MIRMGRAACLAPLLIGGCLTSCKRPELPPPPPGARPVQELRADCAALDQFAKDLQAQPAENDFQRFAASPYNYTFVVRESRDSYTFFFGIKPYHGRLVIDEGTAYKVDKANMKVARVGHL